MPALSLGEQARPLSISRAARCRRLTVSVRRVPITPDHKTPVSLSCRITPGSSDGTNDQWQYEMIASHYPASHDIGFIRNDTIPRQRPALCRLGQHY
jgi:hypothetical protein